VIPVIGGTVVSKTCTALKRKLRHFAKQPSGAADFRVYSSPEEMIEFHWRLVGRSGAAGAPSDS